MTTSWRYDVKRTDQNILSVCGHVATLVLFRARLSSVWASLAWAAAQRGSQAERKKEQEEEQSRQTQLNKRKHSPSSEATASSLSALHPLYSLFPSIPVDPKRWTGADDDEKDGRRDRKKRQLESSHRRSRVNRGKKHDNRNRSGIGSTSAERDSRKEGVRGVYRVWFESGVGKEWPCWSVFRVGKRECQRKISPPPRPGDSKEETTRRTIAKWTRKSSLRHMWRHSWSVIALFARGSFLSHFRTCPRDDVGQILFSSFLSSSSVSLSFSLLWWRPNWRWDR